MFINPHTAIEEGWVSGISDPETQIQPNAIDFTLDHLYTVDYRETFVISNESKIHRGGEKMETNIEDFWELPNSWYGVYDGMSDVTVKLPEGVVCMLIIRSTLNRNGLFLTSGLYDSGFEGPIGFAIRNGSGPVRIKRGTRVGQIMFIRSESNGLYAGGYNREAGQHWTESEGGKDVE